MKRPCVPLSDKYQYQRQKWFKQLVDAEPSHPVKTATFKEDQSCLPYEPYNRKVGRPRENWVDNCAQHTHDHMYRHGITTTQNYPRKDRPTGTIIMTYAQEEYKPKNPSKPIKRADTDELLHQLYIQERMMDKEHDIEIREEEDEHDHTWEMLE